MSRIHRTVLCCLSLWAEAEAQQPAPVPVRVYLPNPANEDWSFLKDPKYRADYLDPIKYMPLRREGWYVTLGGEIRIMPQGFRIRSSSGEPALIDSYLLQRYLFSADVHMGKNFRFFGEIQSGIISGKLQTPRPSDKDLLEIHQGYVEWRPSMAESKGKFAMRVGRQELAIGSSRLIAASQGLNVKRSFDGVDMNYIRKGWVVEGGAARLVRVNPGFFDDPPDSDQEFWAVAVTKRSAPWKSTNLSGYYLGINRKVSQYEQGVGQERRHTMGVKLARAGRLDYNYDAIFQWGQFRQASVRAWAVSTDTGYRLALGKLRPRIGVSANAASGDRDAKEEGLQSFNPLFPGSAYSGMIGLLGPTNLIDVTPTFRVPVHKKVLLSIESPFYIRQSRGDGLYAIDLRLLIRSRDRTERFVGANPGVVVIWQATRHVTAIGSITRFLPGGFLKGTFVESGFGFYSISGTYRF